MKKAGTTRQQRRLQRKADCKRAGVDYHPGFYAGTRPVPSALQAVYAGKETTAAESYREAA